MPSGYRGVRGKRRALTDVRCGLRIGMPGLHELSEPLQDQKRRMTFVHVPHRWRQPERTEHPYTADSQQDFLAQADLLIPAVQATAEFAVTRSIVGHVRVEEVESHPSHSDLADHSDDGPAGHFNSHQAGAAGRCRGDVDRGLDLVEGFVFSLLPSFG